MGAARDGLLSLLGEVDLSVGRELITRQALRDCRRKGDAIGHAILAVAAL